MSDAMVTPSLLAGAGGRASTPERTAAELRRMRQEEPHLYRAMKDEIEALVGDIHASGSAAEAGDAARARAERIVASLYAALRLGHERLWRRDSGISPPPGSAGDLPVELREEVLGLLSEGRRGEAVRRLRQAAKLGLKEAREMADRLEREFL